MKKNKYCILNNNKLCNNCGECNLCDLDPNKICDNCGKCLELEGYDMKAIKIDKVVNSTKHENKPKDKKEEDYTDKNLEPNLNLKEEDIKVDFIEDINGLKEVLQDEGMFKEVAYESFPGFIRIKNQK